MILKDTLVLHERRNGSRSNGSYPCKFEDMQIDKYNSYSIIFKCDKCGEEQNIPYSKLTQMTKIKGLCAKCYKSRPNISAYDVPSGLSQGLRFLIKQWRLESLEHCNSKCVITGKPSTTVHHLKSYCAIVSETLKTLNINPYSDITDEQVILIKPKLSELHYKYGYGVVLSKKMHKLFHDEYGEVNNTPEQFEKFKTKQDIKVELNLYKKALEI